MRLIPAALALAACSWSNPEPEPAVATEAAEMVAASPQGKERPAKGTAGAGARKGAGRTTVVFIVLDTVRAQSTSLCGHTRPTTPYLENLRDKHGFSASCDAYAGASWTVPSHASYFTGMTVPEHHLDHMGRVFPENVPVLAEQFAERGYQTVMISANPTLSEMSGLQRGFETVEVARSLLAMRGTALHDTVQRVVDELDPSKPLFLFLNVLDAHDPYPEVPPGLNWVPPRPELPLDARDRESDNLFHRFVRREMSPDEELTYLAAVRDGYDYGVSLADKAVEATLRTLRKSGWMKPGHRVVITSDHGEYLGEHQLLRHGLFSWEPVVKVPFLFHDSARETPLALPEPMSAINAYHLLLHGEIPTPTPTVASYSQRRKKDPRLGHDMAALWLPGGEKLLWMRDDFLRVDLAVDPDELKLEPLSPQHPERARMEAIAQEHLAHLVKMRAEPTEQQRVEELEALGYVE